MLEAIIKALNTAPKLIETRIGKLELGKNLVGQYNHEDIMTLKEGIKNILSSQWNAPTPGQKKNTLTKIKEAETLKEGQQSPMRQGQQMLSPSLPKYCRE